jgi:copper resistance protein C
MKGVSAMYKIAQLSVLLSLLCSSVAWGHAFPKTETPGAGEVIASKSTTVSITFNSQIEPIFSTLRVLDKNKHQVSSGKGATVKDNPYLLETQIPALPPGDYQVSWSVIARDTHHTEGKYTFSVR